MVCSGACLGRDFSGSYSRNGGALKGRLRIGQWLSHLDDFLTTFNCRDHARPQQRQTLHEDTAHRISDSNPYDGRASAVQGLQEDEIFVLCYHTTVHLARTAPDREIGCAFQAQIGYVIGIMTLGDKPASKRRRKIRVDQKSHRSEAVNTG